MKPYSKAQENEFKLFFLAYGKNENVILQAILGLFLVFARVPSLIIEVFLRRKFGERYFTLSANLAAFLLLLMVAFAPSVFRAMSMPLNTSNSMDSLLFIFSVAFMLKSLLHRKEISKYGATYSLERFSLSQGLFHPFFEKRIGGKLLGIPVNPYTIQIIFEPFLAMISGFLMLFIPFTQATGVILFLSGIIMMVRQFYRMQAGRNAVLDIIDEYIVTQSKSRVIMDNVTLPNDLGLSLPVALPDDQKIREMILDKTQEPLRKDSWSNDHLDQQP